MDTDRYLFWRPWVMVGLVGFAVGVGAYWTAFFTHDVLHVRPDDYHLIYQRNFPLPDGVMAVLGLLCAAALREHNDTAMLWGLPAAGGILFLGLVDLSHNLWNGHFVAMNGAVACEMFINFYCLTFGPSLMHFLWAHRHAREEVRKSLPMVETRPIVLNQAFAQGEQGRGGLLNARVTGRMRKTAA